MDEMRFLPVTLRLGHAKARAEGEEPAENEPESVVTPDEKGRIPVALSSEFAVERYELTPDWSVERYMEVLEHTPEAVDLTRAALARGLPLLLNHDSWGRDTKSFLGKVEDITVDPDRTMRGWMRFSQRQDAQEVRQDVLDDLRSSVSIGYMVGRDYESKVDKATQLETRTYRDWVPLELSLVPVPADPLVGVGRSADGRPLVASRAELEALIAERKKETAVNVAAPVVPPAAPAAPQSLTERVMPPEVTPTPAAATPTPEAKAVDINVVRAEIKKEASDRVRQYNEIVGLAKGMPADTVQKWIEGEVPVGVALAEARSHIATNANATGDKPLIELTPKDAKRYSFGRAILAQCSGGDLGGVDCGFEKEMAQELRRKSPLLASRSNNMLVPSMLQQRSGLASDEATKGETLKLTAGGEFVDLLRNKSVLLKAGARVISGLTGPLQLPVQTAAGTASWINENPGSDTSITEATLGSKTLSMKSLISVSAYTRQMLIAAASGNYDVEQLIRDDMAAIFALALDAAGIKGGGSEEPTGIIAHTGTNVVTLGAHGGTLTYAKIIELETAVAAQNGDSGSLAYIGRPSLRGFLKITPTLPNITYGTTPIWTHVGNDADGLPQGQVNGYRAYATNQVPNNFSPGTMTTTATALIFGDISQVIFGEWGAFEMRVDENTLAAQAKVRVISTQFVDALVRQYQKLAVCKDINNSSL